MLRKIWKVEWMVIRWLLIPSCFLISIHHFHCVEELKIFEIQCRQCIIERDLKIIVEALLMISSVCVDIMTLQAKFTSTWHFISQYERILALAKLDWNIYHRGRWRVLFASVQTPKCPHDMNFCQKWHIITKCLFRAVQILLLGTWLGLKGLLWQGDWCEWPVCEFFHVTRKFIYTKDKAVVS